METLSDQNKAYFNALTTVFENGDFNQVQMNWIRDNCQSFKDSKEMSAELPVIFKKYETDIFMGYVDTQQTMVDLQAGQNAFYQGFTGSIEAYKQINAETCQTLQQGADAGAFNVMMADLKQSLGVPDAVETSKMSKFIDFNNEAEFMKLCEENPGDQNSRWSKVTNAQKLGITMDIHRKNMDNNEVVWRSKHTVKDFKLAQLEQFCSNFKMTITENKQITEHKVIKEEPNHLILYFAVECGGFLSERDAYCEMKWHTKETGELVIVMQTLTDAALYPVRKDKVRMEMFKASMAKDTDFGYENLEFFNFNMGGNFSPKLMNMVMGSGLAKGIPQMHKDLTTFKNNTN